MKKNGSGAHSNGTAKPSVYTHPVLSNHEIRRVAVSAMCDPRCVVKYLRGMSQAAMVRARIELALRETGHENLIGYATRATANRASLPPASSR